MCMCVQNEFADGWVESISVDAQTIRDDHFSGATIGAVTCTNHLKQQNK